jgi:hypothetical protein
MGMGLGIKEWSIGFELEDGWRTVGIRQSFWKWGIESLYTRTEDRLSTKLGELWVRIESEGRRTRGRSHSTWEGEFCDGGTVPRSYFPRYLQ